jgi:hypothetical protein
MVAVGVGSEEHLGGGSNFIVADISGFAVLTGIRKHFSSSS